MSAETTWLRWRSSPDVGKGFEMVPSSTGVSERGVSRIVPLILVGLIGVSLLLAAMQAESALIAIHATLATLLIMVAVATEAGVYTQIPWILRPSIAASLPTVGLSLAAGIMPEADYWVFLRLWSVLVGGMIVASVLAFRVQRSRPGAEPFSVAGESIDLRKLATLSGFLMGVAMVAAVVFFSAQGVPALSGNVEQGRVDAAVEGTGYFRLLAYMSGPATIGLFVARSRWRFVGLFVAFLIITGMANRSPYIYLFVPVLMVVASRSSFKITTLRVAAVAAALVTLIVGFGTFRVFSQEDFRNYDEYATPLAEGDILGVASASVSNYLSVVPENQVLTWNLVDSGLLELKWGSTYATLLITALPGEQLSLDRQIRMASGRTFLGGGTPPTLAGEGFVNFGYIGTFGAGFFLVALGRYWAKRLHEAQLSATDGVLRGYAAVYGYILCWVVGSPIGGLAGASTVPLAGLLVLVALRASAARKGQVHLVRD